MYIVRIRVATRDHDLQVLAKALTVENRNRWAKGDAPPSVAKDQDDHSRQTTLHGFFDDLISEKEVTKVTVRSAEEPVEGHEPNEDSDSEDEENQKREDVVVTTLRIPRP
jgi:hypothetical protein